MNKNIGTAGPRRAECISPDPNIKGLDITNNVRRAVKTWQTLRLMRSQDRLKHHMEIRLEMRRPRFE